VTLNEFCRNTGSNSNRKYAIGLPNGPWPSPGREHPSTSARFAELQRWRDRRPGVVWRATAYLVGYGAEALGSTKQASEAIEIHFCCNDLMYSVRLDTRRRTSDSCWCSMVMKIGPQTGISFGPCAGGPPSPRMVLATCTDGNLPLLFFERTVRSAGELSMR